MAARLQAPVSPLYFQDLLSEIHRTRVATELIAEALGHLLAHLIEEDAN